MLFVMMELFGIQAMKVILGTDTKTSHKTRQAMNLTHNLLCFSQFSNFRYWLGRGYSILQAWKYRRLS